MKKAESKLIVRFDNHMELTKGTALSLTIQTENDERCTSVRFKGPLTVDAGTEIAFTCSVADQNRRSSMECARCADHLEYIGKEDSGDDANRVYRCTCCDKQIVSAERLM